MASTATTRNRLNKQGRPFNTEDDFLDYVAPEPNSGCWLWLGEVDDKGYGRFWYTYKRESAHRFSFRNYVCDIPDGKLVLHSCDVPCCVNPDHLRIGTHLDNQADAIRRGRHTHGEIHGAAKLNEAAVLQIRSSSEKQAVLAKRYGVTQALISCVKTQKIWRHI